MKGFLLPGVLAGGVVSGGVQQKVSTNSEVMKTNTSTIRLIYPQWQGGNVAAMVPEVKDPDDAARGYYLGAQLLDFLAPCGGQETLTVPVSTQIGERRVTDGVLDRNVILRQTKAALEMLRASDPGQDRDPGRGLLRERGAVHLPCREIRRRRGDGMDRRPSRHHASGRSLSRLPCHGRDGLHGARRCEDRGGTARRIRPVENPVRRVAQLGAGRDQGPPASVRDKASHPRRGGCGQRCAPGPG